MTDDARARTVARLVTAMLALPLAACAFAPRATPRDEVVAAERAFARLADEVGVRAAFAANFAPDAVWMIPAPTTLREAHAARPAPADPRALRLEWDPAIAGVAASGELGYTAGPSTVSLRDRSVSPQHGLYFSIWRKDADGWRVAVDGGIRSTTPVTRARFTPAPAIDAASRPALPARPAPMELERSTASWTRDALARLMADDAMLLANDIAIARGPALVEALPDEAITLDPLGGRVARSGDLAYTYGRIVAPGGMSHYVHLWTRDATGAWRIAIALRP